MHEINLLYGSRENEHLKSEKLPGRIMVPEICHQVFEVLPRMAATRSNRSRRVWHRLGISIWSQDVPRVPPLPPTLCKDTCVTAPPEISPPSELSWRHFGHRKLRSRTGPNINLTNDQKTRLYLSEVYGDIFNLFGSFIANRLGEK